MQSVLVGLPSYADIEAAYYDTIIGPIGAGRQAVVVPAEWIMIPILIDYSIRASAVAKTRNAGIFVTDSNNRGLWSAYSPTGVTAGQVAETVFDNAVGAAVAGGSTTMLPLPQVPIMQGSTIFTDIANGDVGDLVILFNLTVLKIPTSGRVALRSSIAVPTPTPLIV